jgi:hypothetical protein
MTAFFCTIVQQEVESTWLIEILYELENVILKTYVMIKFLIHAQCKH